MTQKLLVIFLTIFTLVIVVAGLGYWWLQTQLQPVSADVTSQRFIVAKGQALSTTAQKLADQGLINNAYVFRYYAQLNQIDRQMQAGSYELNPSMSTQEIAVALTEGTEDLWITLLEGWRREEVATYLSAQEELTQFDEAEFLALTQDSEGTLFPDTYLIPKDSTADTIHTLLTNTYATKVTEGLSDELAASDLSEEEVLVLASIIEREGKGYENMRHVAGVLINRINDGMALNADATLQYIQGQTADGNWWAPPNISVKDSSSPYNTYKYPELPPAPIANPGLNAIKAVLDPLETEDYYYIHTPSGESYFAETLEEHNANIDKYLR